MNMLFTWGILNCFSTAWNHMGSYFGLLENKKRTTYTVQHIRGNEKGNNFFKRWMAEGWTTMIQIIYEKGEKDKLLLFLILLFYYCKDKGPLYRPRRSKGDADAKVHV